MKNEIISFIGIILGIFIIAFPIMGVIGVSEIVGLSILLMSIYFLIVGITLVDYELPGALMNIILGIIMLILSLGLIFNPGLLVFLAAIIIYLAGIFLIIASVITLITNRKSKYGFWMGIFGIVLGVIYIILGSYVSDPFILGCLIGIWLIVSGIFRLLDR
ncbi:MAG: DUF308 domain-containing protein [Methanobacteriaceae archaeon]|jgi:uncharacterized membrane protein HdeD (DUF308 family)|nr:DUF308 domain-containing protein [Methanobacteriaceae archaeon]